MERVSQCSEVGLKPWQPVSNTHSFSTGQIASVACQWTVIVNNLVLDQAIGMSE